MREKVLRATSGAAPCTAGRTRWELTVLAGVLVVARAAAPALARENGGVGGGSFSFAGPIEALLASGLVGDWTVNGVTVHVDASTTIDQSKGTVAVDVSVRVTGELQADASVNATAILVKALQ